MFSRSHPKFEAPHPHNDNDTGLVDQRRILTRLHTLSSGLRVVINTRGQLGAAPDKPALLLKARPAKRWLIVNRLERHNGTLATLSANDARFLTHLGLSRCAGGSALKTTFGSMRELLFMKEVLLICGEDKLGSALNAANHPVPKLHLIQHLSYGAFCVMIPRKG